MVSHWVRYGTEEPFVPNLDKFGFVYIITNTKTTKAYVGCKQYFSMGKKKRKHKWEIYTGSSKYLNEDIEKIGKEHFTFEVIAEYKNKRSLRYYEAYYQMKWNVLTATIEGTDKPAFYNSYVGGKWYRPIESYKPHTEETKKKMSEKKIGEKHPMFGKKHTEETKKKIGEIHFGKILSKETKKKMSEKKTGEKNPMFGRKHTEETKKKISEKKTGEKNFMFGRKHTEETKKKMRKSKQLSRRKEETNVTKKSNV
jgi:group I intron endonuclease